MDNLKGWFEDLDKKADLIKKGTAPVSSKHGTCRTYRARVDNHKSQYNMSAPRQPQSMDPNFKLLARLAAAKCLPKINQKPVTTVQLVPAVSVN